MNLPRRVLLFALLPMLMAGAEEPARKDSSAKGPATTNDSFVEFPDDELLRERQQARQDAEATLQKLRVRQKIKFVDVPLDEAMQQFAKLSQVRFHIDVEALTEEGIAADTPVTKANRKPQRLSDLLDLVLQPIQLGWHIEGNSVRVTTAAKKNEIIETRAYVVGRLLRLAVERDALLPDPLQARGRTGSPREDMAAASQSLERALPEATSGPLLNSSDRSAPSPRVIGERMVVHQNLRNHREIASLLRSVELALARPLGASILPASESDEEVAEMTKLQRLLNTEIEVNFVETPLNDVATFLSERLNEEVVLDNESLTEEGFATDIPMTARGRWPARTALRRLLEPLLLSFELRHGAIVITTQVRQRERLHSVIYDVADLLQAGLSINDLIRVFEESTSGPFLNRDGEGGVITEFPGGLLVIRQTADVQTEVAMLLHDLRQARREDKTPPQANPSKLETRFHRAKSKAEAEALESLLMTFVAPTTWDSSGGRGVLRTAEDRLIIRQTRAIHDQIDLFLREYQQAKPIGPPAK